MDTLGTGSQTGGGRVRLVPAVELTGRVQAARQPVRRRVTVASYAEWWLGERRLLVPPDVIRASTYCKDELALRVHILPFVGAVALEELTRQRCERLRRMHLASGRLAPRTINDVFSIFHNALGQAVQNGWLARSPMDGVRPLRHVARARLCYEPDELERLIACTPAEWRVVIALAGLAGLRQGEIFALRWDAIDWHERRVDVYRSLQRPNPLLTLDQRFGPPKSPSAHRRVPLRPGVLEALQERQHEATANRWGLVVCAPRGQGPVSPTNFQKRVYDPAAKRAGLPTIRFHDLRHTFITICANAGVPMAKISRWVGHLDTRTTEIYLQNSATSERHALELLTEYENRTRLSTTTLASSDEQAQ
jgi:integrase